MARTPTARPVGEHLAVLTRVLRQLAVSKLPRDRVKRVMKHLSAALAELQSEIGK